MAIMSEYSIVPQSREQKLQYKRDYRLNNLKEQRDYQREYYHKNRERISAQRKERYRLKVESQKAAMKKLNEEAALIKKNQ